MMMQFSLLVSIELHLNVHVSFLNFFCGIIHKQVDMHNFTLLNATNISLHWLSAVT